MVSSVLVVVSPPVLTVALLALLSINTPLINPSIIASLIVVLVPGKTVLPDTTVSPAPKLIIAALPEPAVALAAAAAAS